MPIKMAQENLEFGELLNHLLSPDNDVRSQAEEALNKVEVDVRASLLLNSLASSLSAEAKQLSAVLLRRLLRDEFSELETKLSPETMESFKGQVLMAVQVQEQSEDLRKKVCDVAAELAINFIDDDGNLTWPQFPQFLCASANSNLPALKDSALRMFTVVPGVFGNQTDQYLDLIKQMLQQSLLATQVYEVRVQAVRAVAAFISAHESNTAYQKHLADLLPTMIEITVESIKRQDDDVLLKCFIDLAEVTPKFFRNELQNVMSLCLKVLQTEDMDDNWQQLALELTVTLSEMAPAMVRKLAGNIIILVIQKILQMMTLLEDEENWSEQDESEEDDSSNPNVVAETALDRLAVALGGKTMLPQIVNNIPKMLVNSDWKYRHAALMAISSVGEGCHKQMEAMLPQIMEGVLNFLQDPHPRVRYAACNAVGQMSADFAPIFQKKFHEKVIPGLLMVLDDRGNPRTQAHAGAAMVNFCEACPKEILKVYLEAILTKLEDILKERLKGLSEDGKKLVLEQIVTTIAAVADTVEENFIPYYSRFMPFLKYIVENAFKDEYKLLRGKTIECISLVGLAVGPEHFTTDASAVMDILLKAHTEQEIAEDDPQVTYLISAWARICKILGANFKQYLPLVMGSVMKTASMKPEVALFDSEDLQDIEPENDWEFVNLGQQKNFAIKTVGLEEKASACEMLVCYARYLGDGFVDYVEDVLKLMIPLLKFYFHDSVRIAAADSLPYLLECAKCRGQEFLETYWTYACKELLSAIHSEPEQDVVSELMLSFSKCVETLGPGCLTKESMEELIKILNEILNKHFERAVKRGDKRKDEDYDEIVEEQLEDENYEDGYVLSKVTDVMHSLFSTYRLAFFPYFDQLVLHFEKLLAPDRPWADRQWALCVFDDVIEFGGPECVKYKDLFLPALLQYTQDRNSDVRQAAVFGCGVLGQFGGPAFAQVCAEALPHLMQVIMAPEARAPENVNPTENAISAVTKILKYNSSAINCNEIIPIWLSWLPVWEDSEEAPHVYGYLCDLIESNHPAAIGPNGANIPNIVTIFAEAFFREALDAENEVRQRVLAILKQIQSNEEMFNTCLLQLNDDQKMGLHLALTVPAKSTVT